MGDKGDPIGIPKICLYIILLNVKYVQDSTNLIAIKKSFLGIFVNCFMCTHLLLIPSIARSKGTLGNNTVTSRDSSTSVSLTILPDKEL